MKTLRNIFFIVRCQKNRQVSTCRIFLSIAKAMVYHQPHLGWISSITASRYCISSAVGCILFRNDDIQHSVLMICNSFGIDDIHAFGVIKTHEFASIKYSRFASLGTLSPKAPCLDIIIKKVEKQFLMKSVRVLDFFSSNMVRLK